MKDSLWEIPENRFTYILRYFLPRAPYVNWKITSSRLDELISFCTDTRVEAVQFYVNLRDNWYYMPDSLEHASMWADEMNEIIPLLRDAGISYQLNFQNILGADTGNIDFFKDYPWEYLVNQNGITSPGCACPIGQQFRDIMGRQLAAWAATKPDVIWIDDDLRLHNHGLGSNSLDWYCFCPLHLELFSKKCGRYYTREQVVDAILRPGEVSWERSIWLDMLNETICETASWISETIHDISPATRVAQMTSWPDVHAVEGRNWNRFLTAISGNEFKPMIRPTFGPYCENSPIEFINSFLSLDQMLVNVNIQYKGKVDFCPEIENSRFTRWAKSGAATGFQLILAQLQGCKGITLSLFDLEGTPLDEEPLYRKVLKDKKDLLDAIARINLDRFDSIGIGMITDPDMAYKIKLEGIQDLAGLLGSGRTWDGVLAQMGVPVKYISISDAKFCDVVVLDGVTAWLPDSQEMEKILSRGVILDSKAAKILIERGFGDKIGIKSVNAMDHGTSAELFHESVIDGLPEKRMPLRLRKNNWNKLLTCESAICLTTIIDPEGKYYPGTALFENSFGGRVLTYAGCIDLGKEFFNHQRIRWVNAIINWLGKNKFPLRTNSTQRMLTLMKRDCKNKTVLAFANLSADVLNEVSGILCFNKTISRARRLTDAGVWMDIDKTCFLETGQMDYFFKIPICLKLYEWMIIEVEC